MEIMIPFRNPPGNRKQKRWKIFSYLWLCITERLADFSITPILFTSDSETVKLIPRDWSEVPEISWEKQRFIQITTIQLLAFRLMK
jgi:hypothetical protein